MYDSLYSLETNILIPKFGPLKQKILTPPLVESVYIYIYIYIYLLDCVEENIIWWKAINKKRKNASINYIIRWKTIAFNCVFFNR